MTTTDEVFEAFVSISTVLAEAVTSAQASEDPFATLVAHIDQVRAFVNDLADNVGDVEPNPDAKTVHAGLSCAACIQDARNDEAEGKTPRPILPGVTVINGLAVCDRAGRHRIVTAVQHAVAQSGAIWKPGDPLPGQNGMPPGMVG